MHLRAGGVSLVLDSGGHRVLHWGQELTDRAATALPAATALDTAAGTPPGTPLLPLQAQGHQGRPALAGHRAQGAAWSPSFTPTAYEHAAYEHSFHGTDGGAGAVTLRARDDDSALAWSAECELLPSGLLRLRHRLVNDGTSPYHLDALAPVLPLPQRAREIVDFTGRWAKERRAQRQPLVEGAWVRESRRGRPGHDSAYVLSAGTDGFGFDRGEVWSLHVGWSGNQVCYVERLPSAETYAGGGELLLPGEGELAPGEEYVTPWLYGAYSAGGLDGVGAAFHDWLRSREGHPRRPRPVVLNTWEAAYFEHSAERLLPLAERAAAVGVERFVLDDGWFLGRRDDTAGLGDWRVDPAVWPRGLGPLIARVRELGMDFGLWVEPEMVSPDSELFRAHPDWALRAHAADGRLPPAQRHQQVLDLCRPDAYAHVLGALDELLTAYDIAYLKWDHNRDLVEAGHAGRAATGRQTRAVYRLLDELRRRHPELEIESCASGGARADLGILERTDRVWASDCNDALERRAIQRHTSLLLPPELVGAHVGPPRAHSTGRRQESAFRAATALFGSFGIEWDLGSGGAGGTGGTDAADDAERAELTAWIACYKRHRELLHTGRLLRPYHPDPGAEVTAVVAHDGSEALVAYAQLDTTDAERPAPLRLPAAGVTGLDGLDAGAVYRFEAVGPHVPAPDGGGGIEARPRWYPGPVELPAQLVADGPGLALPRLDPETVLLLHATRLDNGSRGPGPERSQPA